MGSDAAFQAPAPQEAGPLASIFQAADELSQTGKPAVIAIDGRCGSGKTWLAERLALHLPCKLVHMDHFYLPQRRRAPDWAQTPAGNMDLERVKREVLSPFAAGALRAYRPYHCRSAALLPPVPLADSSLLVLEGSYSHHPSLAVPGALNIFLTCSKEEQERRLRLREGDCFSRFASLWIPMEERFYCAFGIPRPDAAVVDTTRLFGALPKSP